MQEYATIAQVTPSSAMMNKQNTYTREYIHACTHRLVERPLNYKR